MGCHREYEEQGKNGAAVKYTDQGYDRVHDAVLLVWFRRFQRRNLSKHLTARPDCRDVSRPDRRPAADARYPLETRGCRLSPALRARLHPR